MRCHLRENNLALRRQVFSDARLDCALNKAADIAQSASPKSNRFVGPDRA
jgi:hypothetical protein